MHDRPGPPEECRPRTGSPTHLECRVGKDPLWHSRPRLCRAFRTAEGGCATRRKHSLGCRQETRTPATTNRRPSRLALRLLCRPRGRQEVQLGPLGDRPAVGLRNLDGRLADWAKPKPSCTRILHRQGVSVGANYLNRHRTSLPMPLKNSRTLASMPSPHLRGYLDPKPCRCVERYILAKPVPRP